MCIAGEDEPDGGSTGTGSGAGSVDEIVVTAPRIGIDVDLLQRIDWGEALKIGLFAGGGGLTGGWQSALGAAVGGTAGAIESQEGVDLEDLFVIKNDMIVIPSLPSPYLPMY